MNKQTSTNELRFCCVCKRKTHWNMGHALQNTLVGALDFPGDVEPSRGSTFSATGPAELVPAWKCSTCGRSVRA